MSPLRMRVIACPECHRQYDVTAYPEGKRLRCRCGALFAVEIPEPHAPDLLRCESCGGPLDEDADACGFCSIPIPRSARRMTAVCPACFARMSEDASYCPDCGLKIAPQALAPVPEDVRCPRCAGELVGRELDDKSLVECVACGGMWVTPEVFRRLTAAARAEGRRAPAGDPPDAAATRMRHPFRYLPCLVCGDMMVPRNHAGRSGIAIDVCRDHGVWLDADELAAILAWLRSGPGQLVESDRSEDPIVAAARGAAGARSLERAASASEFPGLFVLLGDLFSDLFD